MSWKFDSKAPQPIPVRCGDGGFLLHHTRLTGRERLAVHEGFVSAIVSVEARRVGGATTESLGLSAATDILWSHVIGWDGVTDEAGNPLAFDLNERNERGARVRNRLDEVMGSVPLAAVLTAVFLQMAANGIQVKRDVRWMFAGIVDDDGFLERLEADLADFLKGPATTDGNSSPTSAAGVTAMTPSG